MPDQLFVGEEPSVEGWGVARCACGCVVLRVGALQESFTPAEFAELYRLVQAAMREFRIPPSHRAVEVFRAATH